MTAAHEFGLCIALFAVLLKCTAVVPEHPAGLGAVLPTCGPIMLEKLLPPYRYNLLPACWLKCSAHMLPECSLYVLPTRS